MASKYNNESYSGIKEDWEGGEWCGQDDKAPFGIGSEQDTKVSTDKKVPKNTGG